MPESRSRLIAAFAAVYLVWGSTYLAIHYAIATIPPFLMAGVRFIIAGTIVCTWGLARGSRLPSLPKLRNASAIGLLLLLGGNGGVVWAEQSVPSGIAALIVAVVPLWLVILEWLRPGGSRPSVGVAIGLMVGLAGVAVLVTATPIHGSTPVNPWGALALILASLSWATGSLLAKHVDLPSQTLTTGIEMLSGGFGLLLLALATGQIHNFAPNMVSTRSLVGLVYLVTFGSLIGFSAYSWLIQHASPAAIGTYAYVNPSVAVFLGWLIAGESINPRTALGASIIVASVILITTVSSGATWTPRTLRALFQLVR